MKPPPFNQPAVLTRVTPLEEPDDDGAPQTTEATEDVMITWFPSVVEEDTNLANTQIETRLVFFPACLGVTGLDRLEFSGSMWQMIGDAPDWSTPLRPCDPVFAQGKMKRVS